MIRPAGGSWTRWALNVTTVLLGVLLDLARSTWDALQTIGAAVRRTLFP